MKKGNMVSNVGNSIFLYKHPAQYAFTEYEAGKFYRGTIGIILETWDMGANFDFIKVLTHDGQVGWTTTEGMKLVG